MIIHKNTKVVCTIGPASESYEVLSQLIDAGMNVMRLNFSHGEHPDHLKKIELIRKLEQDKGVIIPIILDTKGPEIRCHLFKDGQAKILRDSIVRISMTEILGDETKFSVTYDKLFDDVEVGNKIKIDDGNLELDIIEKDYDHHELVTKARNTYVIKNRKGVIAPFARLSMAYVSEKDEADLKFGCEHNVDYVAASFTRRPEDILEIKEILAKYGKPDIGVIAKIENQEGVDKIDAIIDVSDGVMVARGDLGVEVPSEMVPVIQKQIIEKCRIKGKPVITATQMLDSMQTRPVPTRAEVSDVANAILEGTDAVMLSGETAAGRYPLEAVRMMTKIAESSEPYLDYRTYNRRDVKRSDHVISNALSSATVRTAEILNAKAIIVPTMHGFTANLLSNWRPKCRIIGMSPNWDVLRKMQLNWGVTPVKAMRETDTDELIEHSVNTVKEMGYIESGDTVIVTVGVKHKNQPSYAIGETNNMRVIVVN